ncbi:MAG: hypothetical protein KTR31_30390, partial [Myxococcales bacterium]|nr:hypothetical protein [Myxococcales bacterium]
MRRWERDAVQWEARRALGAELQHDGVMVTEPVNPWWLVLAGWVVLAELLVAFDLVWPSAEDPPVGVIQVGVRGVVGVAMALVVFAGTRFQRCWSCGVEGIVLRTYWLGLRVRTRRWKASEIRAVHCPLGREGPFRTICVVGQDGSETLLPTPDAPAVSVQWLAETMRASLGLEGRGDPEDLDPALVELMSASSRQRHAKVLEQHHRNEVSGARWMLAGAGGLWALPWAASAMGLALGLVFWGLIGPGSGLRESTVELLARGIALLVILPLVGWFDSKPASIRTTLDGEALTLRSVLLGITLRTRRLPRSEIVGVRTVERWR